jgi:hypothetical protein
MDRSPPGNDTDTDRKAEWVFRSQESLISSSKKVYVCILCFEGGYTKNQYLYEHCRRDGTNRHKILLPENRKTNTSQFAKVFGQSLGIDIQARDIDPGANCYKVSYIVEKTKCHGGLHTAVEIQRRIMRALRIGPYSMKNKPNSAETREWFPFLLFLSPPPFPFSPAQNLTMFHLTNSEPQ